MKEESAASNFEAPPARARPRAAAAGRRLIHGQTREARCGVSHSTALSAAPKRVAAAACSTSPRCSGAQYSSARSSSPCSARYSRAHLVVMFQEGSGKRLRKRPTTTRWRVGEVRTRRSPRGQPRPRAGHTAAPRAATTAGIGRLGRRRRRRHARMPPRWPVPLPAAAPSPADYWRAPRGWRCLERRHLGRCLPAGHWARSPPPAAAASSAALGLATAWPPRQSTPGSSCPAPESRSRRGLPAKACSEQLLRGGNRGSLPTKGRLAQEHAFAN